MRKSLGCLVVVALLVGAAPSFGQVKLEWKLKEGDKFTVDSTSELNQKMDVSAQKLEQKLKQVAKRDFTVQKKNPDGSMILEEKVESLKFETADGAIGPDDKFGDKLAGTSFKITVGPKGEVSKVEGIDDVVKKLAGEDPASQKMVRAIFQENAVKRTASEMFSFLPEKPVDKGAKWKHDMNVALGPLGTMKVQADYTYEGKDKLNDKEFDKITFTATATYQAAAQNPGDLPFQITKSDLKSQEFKGTIWFDSAAGRMVQSDMNMKLVGKMSFKVGGSDVEAALDQDQTVKSIVTYAAAEKPAEKPPEKPAEKLVNKPVDKK